MVIDESERPPVVAYGGRSPSKSPAARKKAGIDFAKSAAAQGGVGPYLVTTSPRGSFGGNVTPRSKHEQIGENRWDNRHHMSPSLFNTYNHTFYKVSKFLYSIHKLINLHDLPFKYHLYLKTDL